MVIGLTVCISAIFVFTIVELLYAKIIGKPFIVYTHLKLRKLTYKQHEYLSTAFPPYQSLGKKKQEIFGHRVLQFIDHKEFVSRGQLPIDEHKKLLISATAVMLTFGMRRYLIASVKRFIIYPDAYESVLNRAEHIGEYNPSLKTIVFSWSDFLKGHEIQNDNLNLGVHELAHALSYESLKVKDSGSILFSEGLYKIDKLLQSPDFLTQWRTKKYFRAYAQVNKYEFFAVSLEHFIETPEKFYKEFPKLYTIVHQMLNYKFGKESA